MWHGRLHPLSLRGKVTGRAGFSAGAEGPWRE